MSPYDVLLQPPLVFANILLVEKCTFQFAKAHTGRLVHSTPNDIQRDLRLSV